MSLFDPAMDVLIRHEVYAYGTPKQRSWSDLKGDKGGETNWGWSMLNLRKMGLTPRDLGIDQDTFTPGCLKQMPESAARKLYRTYYWEPYYYKDMISQTIGTKLFDFAVNANVHAAGLLVQRPLLSLGFPITVDGSIGPKTVAAINQCQESVLVPLLCAAQANYYAGLIEHDATQEQFRLGWMARARWPNP